MTQLRFDGSLGAALGGGFICDNSHILRETVLGTDCVWLTAPAFVSANGAGMMIEPERAARFFAHLSPPDLAEDAAHRLVAEPLGPLATLVAVTPERWGTVRRLYVECLQDRTVPIANQRQMLALSPGTATVTLDTDHSPFFSAPEALANALIVAAEGLLNSG